MQGNIWIWFLFWIVNHKGVTAIEVKEFADKYKSI